MLIAGLIRACRCGTDTPSFEELLHAFDTRPPVQRNEVELMKERIKGAFTKRKILHFLKMALFVVALSLILLSLWGRWLMTGLVDDTINAENLYSKYPLSTTSLILCG